MCKYCNVHDNLREVENDKGAMSRYIVDIVKNEQFIMTFDDKDGYHYVICGDGTTFKLTPKCRRGTVYIHTHGLARKKFKHCPYCGRRL